MAKRQAVHDMTEDPRYHDTWKLLKRYRDVVWSMELSVQQLKTQFKVEYGSSIEEFLESVYLAGADLSGTQIEDHARCIERSNKMLTLVTNAVDLLRTRHKNGETYYWILYYTYLSPQQLRNVDEIITSSDRTSATSVSAPTIAGERTQLKHSVQFYGATLRRIALVFWNNFSLLKSVASNWHRIGSTLARFCY